MPHDLSVYVEKGSSATPRWLFRTPGADPTAFISETAYAGDSQTPPIRVEPRSLFGDLQKPLERLSSTAEKFEVRRHLHQGRREPSVPLEPARRRRCRRVSPHNRQRDIPPDTLLSSLDKWVSGRHAPSRTSRKVPPRSTSSSPTRGGRQEHRRGGPGIDAKG